MIISSSRVLTTFSIFNLNSYQQETLFMFRQSLTQQQDTIRADVDYEMIEAFGGGSVRCSLLELAISTK